MRRVLLLIVALSFVPAFASAQVEALDQAVAAYEAGNIESALSLLNAAQRSSRAGPEDLHRIHLYLGIIQTVVGEEDAAGRNFAVALAIQPDARAPAELAPDQRQRFERIRSDAHRLEVHVRPVGIASNESASTLRLSASHAPEGLVSSFRARATPASGGQAWTATVDSTEPAELPIPAMAWRSAEQLDVTIEALNEHGGVLASTQTQLTHQSGSAPETALTIPQESPSDDEGGGSVLDEAWFWVVIGVVVAGGAAAGVGLALTLGPETYVLEAPTIQR